jgi:hypothetical protein
MIKVSLENIAVNMADCYIVLGDTDKARLCYKLLKDNNYESKIISKEIAAALINKFGSLISSE